MLKRSREKNRKQKRKKKRRDHVRKIIIREREIMRGFYLSSVPK